jgi:hypothetical protein
MLEHYLIPIAPLILLALDCVAGLFFYVSLEREISTLKARLRRDQKTDQSGARELKLKLDELSERLRDNEERAELAAPPATLKSSLNLNRRTQAIRMSRLGEPAENIAASLSMPRQEVELLLKVYCLALNGSREIKS